MSSTCRRRLFEFHRAGESTGFRKPGQGHFPRGKTHEKHTRGQTEQQRRVRPGRLGALGEQQWANRRRQHGQNLRGSLDETEMRAPEGMTPNREEGDNDDSPGAPDEAVAIHKWVGVLTNGSRASAKA